MNKTLLSPLRIILCMLAGMGGWSMGAWGQTWPIRLMIAIFLLSPTLIFAQPADISWRSESTTGEWEYGQPCGSPNADNHWWNLTTSNYMKRPDCGLQSNRIHFNNNVQPNMTLNGADYTVNQIIFEAGTPSRTINGPANLYFWQNGVSDGTIENNVSMTTHIFNANVNIQTGTWMQIRVNDGDLRFDKPIVNNSGNTLNFRGLGGRKIFVNDLLQSSIGAPGVSIANEPTQNVVVVYGGADNTKTYSGPTTIYSGGTLQISSNQTLGDIVINSGGKLIVDAGKTLVITGSWTGGGTIENYGTIFLAGSAAQSFPGATSTVTAMNNLTINNFNGVSLDQSMTITGTLALNEGVFILGSNNLTLSATTNVVGTLNASHMIVADGTGELRKIFTGNGSFTFPVGDMTGAAEYSPITLDFTAGSYAANAYAAVRVVDAKHPNNVSVTNYLTRYWPVSSSGISGFSCTVTGNFSGADINGAVGNMVTGKWIGSLPWQKYGIVDTRIHATGVTSFGDFTGISSGPTVTISANPALQVCQNSSLTLTANAVGDPPITYAWSPGGLTTPSISPSTAASGSTTYSVTVTDGNGLTASSSATVVVDPLPAAPTGIAANPSTICNGASSTISVTNPGGSLTTDWYTVSCGGTPVTGGTGVNSLSVSPSVPTTYYARTRNTITGCISTTCATVSVDVNPLPASPTGTSSSPASICSGASSTISVANPGGNLTTDWYTVSCGGTPVTGGTGVNSLSVSPSVPTTYYARTRNTITGCISTTCATVSVDVNPLPASPTGISSSPASICSGASSTISVSNPGAGFTTDWFTGSCGGTPVPGGTGMNSLVVNPAATTVYYARTRNTSSACVSACVQVTVTVNSIPSAPSGITATPLTIQYGNSSTLSATVGGGETIDWFTGSCGGTPVTGGTGVTSVSVSPTSTTTYYARARNTSFGCVSIDCANVTVNVSAKCPADFSTCQNVAPINLTTLGALPTGGKFSGDGVTNNIFNADTAGAGPHVITYSLSNQLVAYWNFNSGTYPSPWTFPIAATQGTGSINIGNWNSTYTDHFTGSTVNALSGDPAGNSLGLIAGTGLVNNNHYIEVSASMAGKKDLVISYWNRRPPVDAFTTGQWSYSTDGGSTWVIFNTHTIATGVVTISVPSAADGIANLLLRYTLSGATSTQANNRLDNIQLNAATTGLLPCTFTITVHPKADPMPGSSGSACLGEILNLTSADGYTTYSWSGPNDWKANVQNPNIFPVTDLAKGTYTVTVSDANSCTGSSSIYVNVFSAPTQASINPVSPVCVGSTITLTGNPSGNIAYNWYGPDGWSTASTQFSTSQNFNLLATSGTSSTLPANWYFAETGTNANTTYSASDGTSTAGDTYSFGTGTSTDRALGGLYSGTLTPYFGYKFVNGTGNTLSTVMITYTGEHWRQGTTGRADRLDFQWSTDASDLLSGLWTDENSLDYVANINGSIGALNGNLSPNFSSITYTFNPTTPIAPGMTFFIRWADFNASGADDGLAVDDFSMTLSSGSSAQTVTRPGATLLMGGTYTLKTTDVNGCIVSATTNVTVNPTNTITLTSASGTDAQTKCINTAITPITYSTTGATGATITGLPAGVTGSWAGNVVTISGTPTAAGTLTYTVTLNGGCGTVTATGTITVTPNMTAGPPSSSPTLCVNTSISPVITIATTGATGIGAATGLPAGVTANWASNTITISGTPTASGTFSYVIPLTGGCGTVNATGTIIVSPNATITLTSAAGTDNQTVYVANAITAIQYTTTGAAGVIVTGLPPGVTGVFSAGIYTITGNPTATGTYNYTVTTTGSCVAASLSGTIKVIDKLTVSKEMVAPIPTRPGQPFVYKILYSNANPAGYNALNVTVTDVLPSTDYFTYSSASPAPASYSGGVLTWQFASLPPGSYEITVTGTLGRTGWSFFTGSTTSFYTASDCSSKAITNTATITNPMYTAPLSAPVTLNFAQDCSVSIDPASITGYIKSATPSYIYYLFTINNTGNITNVYNLTTIFTSGNTNLTSVVQALNGTNISSTPPIAPGDSYQFMVRVGYSSGGVNPEDTYVFDLKATSVVCNCTAISEVTTIAYGGQPPTGKICDLQIIKDATPEPATVGSNLVYTLTVNNMNPYDAKNIDIRDTIPTSLTYVSSTASAGVTLTYNAGTRSILALKGTQQNTDQAIVITITVTPNCDAAPSVTNKAYVSSSTAEDVLTNNKSVKVVAVNSNITPPGVSANSPVCSGLTSTLTATGAAGGESYKWYTVATGGTPVQTGGSTYTTPALTVNTTYYVSIYNTTTPACESNRASIQVDVNPVAAITNMTVTACSGAGFTVTPVNGTNGTVPAGTTYSWAAPTGTGFTGGAAGSNAASITGTLVNTTTAPVTATYTVTPVSGTCIGSTFTVTVTVNPAPAITDMTAITCSGVAFTATPANGTNGIVPAGTTYTWGAPVVTGGMTGGAASSGSPPAISGTLVNNSGSPQTATYTVTPTSGAAGSCVGANFTVTVTVYPTPIVTGTLGVCVGKTTQLSSLSAPASPPAWISGTPTVASVDNTGLVTGVSAGSSIITYTDSNGCSRSVTVTVNALPSTSPIYHR